MKLGIMQPYIFPYLGYYQLINCVDKFVVYDDVTYIKQGWINRNKILVGGKEHLFTIHLKKVSSNVSIRDTEINYSLYNNWKKKFFATLDNSYKRAPYYSDAIAVVHDVFNKQTDSIADLALYSIKSVCSYLGIDTEIVDTSTVYNNNDLAAQGRVLDICKKENANTYINVPGGADLYSKKDFLDQGITLNFIKPNLLEYPQFDNIFVKGLSMIDVLMFNSVEDTHKLLASFELQ